MGRKPTTNFNLPAGLRARKRARKNGAFVVYYFYDARQNGRRKEIPLGTDYVAAVREWARLEAEKVPKGCEATFSTAAERYRTEVIPRNAAGTQKQKTNHLRVLYRFFGKPDAPLSDIEPQHIRQYLDWRKSAPKAANNEIATFSHIWNCAREWGYTDRPNPCLGVKRYPSGKRDVYIEDRIYALVYQAANQKLRDLMDIAYLIGQRPVDVVKLHTDCIHNGILHITQQKTKIKQRFEIVGQLAQIIARRLPENGGYLFRNKRGGKLTAAVLADNFLDLRRKLMAAHPELAHELKNFQFRDLRAKSATDIYLSSTLTQAKEQLGHASERMTQTYIRQTKLQRPLERVCGTPPDFAEK